MPRGNGTGPEGMGPMTGWGRGYCRSDRYPRGRRGYSYGNSRRFRGPAAWGADYINPKEEKVLLEDEKDYLKTRLEEVNEVLDKLNEE